MAKLIHYNSTTASAVPLPANLVVGQIAINHADRKLFIIDSSSGNVVVVGDANYGTVKSVNAQSPNGAGAVTLTPANLGATTVGSALFTAASAGAAQTTLGASTIGATIFGAADAAAVRTAISAVATTQIGAANGVAPLGSDSKLPTSYLPDSILGGVNFQSVYNASTNTPAVPAAASGNKGWYYVTSVAGTYTPGTGSPVPLEVGDWLLSDGTAWSRVDAQDAVTSVAGRTGAIVLGATDIASGTFVAARLGASSGNSLVLTTNSSGTPTWVSALPAANLPVATTSAQGIVQIGSGLTVTSGTIAVDVNNLTLNEGTF
jgi:hypothetical protein